MECPTRHVHHVVIRERGLVVLDLECVRELETEGEPLGLCDPLEVVEHRDGVRVLEIVTECLVRNDDVCESELIVDDPAHALRAEQRRVALHRGVQATLLEQVGRDLLDLLRRASVHGGQRHRVRDSNRNVDVSDLGVALCNDVDVRPEIVRGVFHDVEVPLHVRFEDPLEVVADTHVEDHSRCVTGEAKLGVEGVDQHPCP